MRRVFADWCYEFAIPGWTLALKKHRTTDAAIEAGEHLKLAKESLEHPRLLKTIGIGKEAMNEVVAAFVDEFGKVIAAIECPPFEGEKKAIKIRSRRR